MKYTATVEASKIGQPMELCGLCGAPGDYLVVMGDSKILFLRPELFEGLFRPVVNSGAPAKAAREPKEAAEEPGRKAVGIGAAILRGLKDGPKVVSAVTDWMQAHGYPDYTTTRAGLALGYQARKGSCELGKDRVWRLKG